jgi:leucyl-tRNA---protein transferase
VELPLFEFATPPSPCSYLPGATASLQYQVFGVMSASDYCGRMTAGWRRFGHTLFRPQCPKCTACRSLRVPVATFRPNRSQRRAWRDNGDVQLFIGRPGVTREKLDLYDSFHAFQSGHRGWPLHAPKDAAEYLSSFVENPFPTEEWCFYLGDELVGVGYVDVLPAGLSAIYFYHDPSQRRRSLGTFNVLGVIAAAERRGLPYVYLGYYVEGCSSLEYKGNFTPNERLEPDGRWVPFRA